MLSVEFANIRVGVECLHEVLLIQTLNQFVLNCLAALLSLFLTLGSLLVPRPVSVSQQVTSQVTLLLLDVVQVESLGRIHAVF